MHIEAMHTAKVIRENALDYQGKRVAIIGAGIAGLATAYYLKKHGVAIELLEREDVIGGMTRSSLKQGQYIVEFGTQSFSAADEAVARLSRELSLEPLIVSHTKPTAGDAIIRKGRSHAVPSSLISLMKSPLISMRGKARVLVEPFMPARWKDAESLAMFTQRRVGREMVEAIVEPIASCTWAADPDHIEIASQAPGLLEAVRRRGSLFRAIRKDELQRSWQKRYSFRWGMGTLTARLEELLRNSIHANHACQALERKKGGGLRVLCEEGPRPLDVDAVILATPAYAAANILSLLSPRFLDLLSEIHYAPMAVLHFAFRKADIPASLSGGNCFVPKREHSRILGLSKLSAQFPGRCPSEEDLVAVSMGGVRDQEVMDLNDEELTACALEELKKTTHISAPPRFTYVKRWARAFPQYTIGHASRIAEVNGLLESQPGIFLTGSYLKGVSMSHTISRSRQVADQVLAYLKAH